MHKHKTWRVGEDLAPELQQCANELGRALWCKQCWSHVRKVQWRLSTLHPQHPRQPHRTCDRPRCRRSFHYSAHTTTKRTPFTKQNFHDRIGNWKWRDRMRDLTKLFAQRKILTREISVIGDSHEPRIATFRSTLSFLSSTPF